MTEIPEHLLKRAAAARAATSGEDPPADTPAGSPVADTPAAAAPAPPSEVPAEAEPEPLAPYIVAHNARRKIPWWAVSALLLLPLWAFTYVGTLERPPQEATGVLAEGDHVYAARCASCHGATGSGGSGYPLADGEVLTTFPSIADHVVWVVQGSDAVGLGNSYGDPARNRTVIGGMPGWGDVLTREELLGVVLHERARLSGSEDDAALAEAIDDAVHGGTLDLGGHFDPVTITTQEVDDLLASASGDGDGH
ncbi:MAG: c-type cytochrome [Actinobacteria bacterium]|nr:c-type cytochrome [Actinomycetota bacterium]